MVVWLGPKPRPDLLIDMWRDKHPDWEHCLVTREDGWALSDILHRQPTWHGRADLIRWSALWEHGGVAVDADSACLRPLDARFLETAWAAHENEEAAPGLIACGAMGFPPRHSLVGAIIETIRARSLEPGWSDLAAWRSVGPGILTELAKLHPIRVFPAGLFYPLHHSGARAACDEPPFASQKWGSTAGPHFGYRGLV